MALRVVDGRFALRATWLLMQVTARFSTRLAGLASARLWFTPWKLPVGERAAERERRWLEGTRPLRLPTTAGDLAAFEAGEGPIVLLVHGWGDRASRLGAFAHPLVAAGYRVVGIDLPAHGDSPGEQTNAFVNADAIASAAGHLGPLHAVVGHSMGAHGIMLALRNGLRPRSVVLLAPGVRLDRALDGFQALFRVPPRAMSGLKETIARRFGSNLWEVLRGDNLVRGVDVPALVIHDTDDSQVDIADARALVEGWSSARLIETTGLGHNKLVRSSAVTEQVLEFVSLIQAAPKQRTGAAT